MSPALNGSSEIQHFECVDAIEIHDGVMFIFYLGLPHIYVCNRVSDRWVGLGFPFPLSEF